MLRQEEYNRPLFFIALFSFASYSPLWIIDSYFTFLEIINRRGNSNSLEKSYLGVIVTYWKTHNWSQVGIYFKI